jgi:phosphoesterase RecJ-like protein
LNSLSDIALLIKKHSRLAICSHVFPDPDAIGSSVGLQRGLSSIGIHARVCLSAEPIERMRPFIQRESIEPIDEIDLILCVDTATRARADALPNSDATIVNIDHHESNELWGDLNYVDPRSASSSMIVAELLDELGVELQADVSNLLLAGLVDDTGSFRYSNTDAKALRAAANFIECGAEPEKIANALYFTVPERRLRLQARALERLKILRNGTIGIVSVDNAILGELGASADDTDGLVDIARCVAGVQAAVFIREFQGKWKLSLRSQSDSLNVNAVAGVYGGGGHPAAAGCTLEGTLEEVEQSIVKTLSRFMK